MFLLIQYSFNYFCNYQVVMKSIKNYYFLIAYLFLLNLVKTGLLVKLLFSKRIFHSLCAIVKQFVIYCNDAQIMEIMKNNYFFCFWNMCLIEIDSWQINT